MNGRNLAALAAGLILAAPAAAHAATFNGRIAFSSFRVDPTHATGDIFTMNDDGSGLRQLTDNPEDDAQSDWSPDGRDIAYRIRKPGQRINFEVSRMTASGADRTRLTFSPDRQASSQPAWYPDGSAILFRRSGPGLVASIWHMGLQGESPEALFDPPGAQFYPSFSPDMSRLLFATTKSPVGDTDRAIETMAADGSGLTTLFDVPGAFDSGPAWSPDGTRIAFESNADVAGGNPGHDEEIWVMDADGSNPTQLTYNAIHDEGAAWSPDGTMLAYSSGTDNDHVDINVMTASGAHLRQLTDFPGRDESPDWQAIPAPATDMRCGDLPDAGIRDVRATGEGMSCEEARGLAADWSPGERKGGRPDKVWGYDAAAEDFGGLTRVILTHRGNHDDGTGNHKLVAFLVQG
jgi:Tol biopolymer transport system component